VPEVEPPQIPTIIWLLQSGGLAPLAMGFVVAVLGIFFVIRPNHTASMILAFLSLLPAVFGLVAVYSAATAYGDMAKLPTMPKPSEFATLTGQAMGSSFCGLLGTILPIFVAILAMSRSSKRANNS